MTPELLTRLAADLHDDVWAEGHADYDHGPENCDTCARYVVAKIADALAAADTMRADLAAYVAELRASPSITRRNTQDLIARLSAIVGDSAEAAKG
jgi:hypothetical protein